MVKEAIMRILIIGGSGFLGKKLMTIIGARTEVYGTYYSNKELSRSEKYVYLNALSRANVERVLSSIKPGVVIHTVGLPDPDRCEIHKELAYKINVETTKIVAKACQRKNIMMVYISTNYIFNGTKPPYKEQDKPSPINWYGTTKLMGENVVKEILGSGNYLIVRLPLLYGYSPGDRDTLILKIVRNLKAGKKIKADNVRWRYPTLVDDVALAINKLIEIPQSGVFHISSEDRMHKYDFLIKAAKVLGLPYELIEGVTNTGIAKRPLDPRLSITKLKNTIKVKMRNVDEGLRIVKRQLLSSGALINDT